METATVVCRSCGRETVVRMGEPGTLEERFWFPDECGNKRCKSTDLVMLRNLTPAELDELLEEVEKR